MTGDEVLHHVLDFASVLFPAVNCMLIVHVWRILVHLDRHSRQNGNGKAKETR